MLAVIDEGRLHLEHSEVKLEVKLHNILLGNSGGKIKTVEAWKQKWRTSFVVNIIIDDMSFLNAEDSTVVTYGTETVHYKTR